MRDYSAGNELLTRTNAVTHVHRRIAWVVYLDWGSVSGDSAKTRLFRRVMPTSLGRSIASCCRCQELAPRSELSAMYLSVNFRYTGIVLPLRACDNARFSDAMLLIKFRKPGWIFAGNHIPAN
jgi:hypothetical protein